jgi:hypothetical protein
MSAKRDSLDNDAERLLASATDLLNTWAREMSVEQARTPEDIRGVIDRLWSAMSTPVCTGCGLPIIQDQQGFAQILCGVCIEKRFIAPTQPTQPEQPDDYCEKCAGEDAPRATGLAGAVASLREAVEKYEAGEDATETQGKREGAK